MGLMKVAIGRGIYEIPTEGENQANQILKITKQLNEHVNNLIVKGNLKSQSNDLLILLASIEIITNNQNSTSNSNSSANNEQQTKQTQKNQNLISQNEMEEIIEFEVERAVVAHLQSLLNSVKKIINP